MRMTVVLKAPSRLICILEKMRPEVSSLEMLVTCFLRAFGSEPTENGEVQ